MSVQEAKLIRIAITQVVKQDTEFKTYTVRVSELANFLEISGSNLYRDIKGICESLMKRLLYIGTGDPKHPWKMAHWVSSAEYDGQGNITLRLSDELKPYILALEEYNKYKLENVLKMRSFYAIRIYELLKVDEYKGNEYMEFSIFELRKILECEETLTRISDFKSKVIDRSVAEINQKTDMQITSVQYIKNGRSIDRVRFYIELPHIRQMVRKGVMAEEHLVNG
jgi:plasmid replication initiation protein